MRTAFCPPFQPEMVPSSVAKMKWADVPGVPGTVRKSVGLPLKTTPVGVDVVPAGEPPGASARGTSQSPRVFQIGVGRVRGGNRSQIRNQVRLFVVLRLGYRGEQEKRKGDNWKRLPGLTCGQHLRILPKRDFRCETRPMRSQTNFCRLDSWVVAASRIPSWSVRR